MILVPLVVVLRSADPFRIPKTSLFEVFALAIGVVLVLGFRSGRLRDQAVSQRALMLSAAAIGWAAVVSILHPAAFAPTPFKVFCFVFFFGAVLTTKGITARSAYFTIVIPAVINVVIAIAQSADFWSLFRVDTTDSRMKISALIGNPNDIADYLLVPCLMAIAGGMIWRRHRVLCSLTAALLFAGMALTRSAAGLSALLAGIFMLAIVNAVRTGSRFRVPVVIAVIAASAAGGLFYQRIARLSGTDRAGSVVEITSFRLPAYYVALQLFASNPLFGSGPGGFSAGYMRHRLALDEQFPGWIRTENVNFGEVHSDHLQLLSEGGLPAYGIFLAALILLARTSLPARNGTITNDCDEARLSGLLGLPVAASFFLLSLTHFPLQLTAPLLTLLFVTALCLRWSEPEPDTTPGGLPWSRPTRALLAILVIAVSTVTALRIPLARQMCNARRWQIENELPVSLYRSNSFASLKTLRQIRDESVECLDRFPDDYAMWMVKAASERMLGMPREAVASYRRALAVNERPEILANLAVVELESGDYEAARRHIFDAAVFNIQFADLVDEPLRSETFAKITERINRLHGHDAVR